MSKAEEKIRFGHPKHPKLAICTVEEGNKYDSFTCKFFTKSKDTHPRMAEGEIELGRISDISKIDGANMDLVNTHTFKIKLFNEDGWSMCSKKDGILACNTPKQ